MASTSLATDPTLYLYTSLTAGSSHIITATSRLETILKANKIPFRAVDCATDEKARMLWGRRSKGRKLPGLVKFGSIIGDLEQIEEWNEYGELKEQIAASDEFGNLGSSTLAPNPPAVATTTSSTPQRSGPPSRASSETRHISIAEPSDKEKEKGISDSKTGASHKSGESPMNLAIRQLGAEAAAKASQKKTAAAQALKAAAVATREPSTTDQTPTTPSKKLIADAAVDDPDTAAEATAAKTPTQLASEGATKTADKIAESEEKSLADAQEPSSASKEEQILELRRSSSTTKAKSRLSDVTPIAESHTVTEEPSASRVAVAESEISVTAPPPRPPRQHRGSDIGEASPEEIRALEKRLSIKEESEEEDEDEDEEEEAEEEASSGDKLKAKDVTITDKSEIEVAKGIEPQETDAKDADKAGVSVGD